jgi:hypothetical protein
MKAHSPNDEIPLAPQRNPADRYRLLTVDQNTNEP